MTLFAIKKLSCLVDGQFKNNCEKYLLPYYRTTYLVTCVRTILGESVLLLFQELRVSSGARVFPTSNFHKEPSALSTLSRISGYHPAGEKSRPSANSTFPESLKNIRLPSCLRLFSRLPLSSSPPFLLLGYSPLPPLPTRSRSLSLSRTAGKFGGRSTRIPQAAPRFSWTAGD